MKYQKCPVCEGLGKVPSYWDMTYGYISIPTDCKKCNGQLVIEEPNEEPSQEAIISFYKRLTIGFAVGFFGLITALLIIEYLGLMCGGGI